MDGMEATQQILTLPNNPGVPIIAVTADVFPEGEARCRSAGMATSSVGRLSPKHSSPPHGAVQVAGAATVD
jgi:CheY-like chemotaxis protein